MTTTTTTAVATTIVVVLPISSAIPYDIVNIVAISSGKVANAASAVVLDPPLRRADQTNTDGRTL